jgi:TusA-related sulfurtransferase
MKIVDEQRFKNLQCPLNFLTCKFAHNEVEGGDSIVIKAEIKLEFSNLTSLVSREFDVLCTKGIAFANKKGKG